MDDDRKQDDQVWSYHGDVDRTQGEIIGYDVAATDGEVGTVQEETLETDRSYLVVDTGFWLFGTKRLVPAGAVTSIDHDERTIHVDMSKDQLKSSPEYESAALHQASRSSAAPDSEDPNPYTAYYAGVAWSRP